MPTTSWHRSCRRRGSPRRTEPFGYPGGYSRRRYGNAVPVTSVVPPDEGRLLDDRYRLQDRLGTGGVAEVYRALDERLQREVAIKLFRGDVADQLQRHEDEMRLLARLDHPALVTVFDAGADEGQR